MNYDNAITDFDKAIELKPDYAYHNRGTAYYKKGEYDNANRQGNRDYVNAYYNRGLAYFRKVSITAPLKTTIKP